MIEFRGWARQLVAAMAVVIGLEVTLLLKVLELRTHWKAAAIAKRLVVLGYQMIWTKEIPKNPQAMRYALRKGAASSHALMGEQYAHAYHDRRAISKKIAAELATGSKGFIRSLLVGLLVAVIFATVAAFFQAPAPQPMVVISPPRD